MTIAQLMECMMGKVCCFEGTYGDATPFSGCSVEDIARVLERSGLERYGNEVLYNGRTGEMLRTDIFIGPTYYQRLKHMVADKSHCLTADHQVLTRTRGWVPIPEVTIEDEVAILRDRQMVYEHPEEVLCFPDYRGPMYVVSTHEASLITTMNHRMWASVMNAKRGWSAYQLVEARDLLGATYKFKRTGGVGAGGAGNGARDPEASARMLAGFLAGLGAAARVTDEMLAEMTEEDSRAAVRALVGAVGVSGKVAFLDARDADRFQVLVLHAGWSGIVAYSQAKRAWEVTVATKKTCAVVNDIRNPNKLAEQTEEVVENFAGPVYCLRVSTEVFLVRRQGRAVWTGNSRGSNGPVVMLTRQPAEGRARNGGLRFGSRRLPKTVRAKTRASPRWLGRHRQIQGKSCKRLAPKPRHRKGPVAAGKTSGYRQNARNRDYPEPSPYRCSRAAPQPWGRCRD